MMTTQSKSTSDPLVTFKTGLHQHFTAALDAPTPELQEVQRLMDDLDKARTTLESTSVDEVRVVLESIKSQHRAKRGDELAVAICEVAGSLGIMMNPSTRSARSGSHGPRPRYTPEQRQQMAQRLITAIQSCPGDGLSKAEIAQHLNLTSNQVKRILQWPEVQSRVVGIGAARHRRYGVKAVSPISTSNIHGDK